eukprot:scaffold112242_cov36-Phaeocystis_antarctica.AAC.1
MGEDGGSGSGGGGGAAAGGRGGTNCGRPLIVSAVSIEPLRSALARVASVKSMRVFFLPAA